MKTTTEWKVGLFLAISLALVAALVVNFSKGTNPFTETTLLHLTTKNVDGLKRNSVVLMAGVPVGKISAIHLNTDTGIVTLDAKIKAEYQIRADAKFFIETAGFLGDKYIGVIPGANELPPLNDGATVACEESFDLVRTARSATDLIDELKVVATQVTNIVNRIDSKLLDEQTLTNLAAGLSNLREISAKASDTIAGVERLISTNTPPIQNAVSNVVEFSEQLKATGLCVEDPSAVNSCDLWSMCEILQLVEDPAQSECFFNTSPNQGQAGYCYIDPAQGPQAGGVGPNGVGDPTCSDETADYSGCNNPNVATCSAAERRLLRFVGYDDGAGNITPTPANDAITFVACFGDAAGDDSFGGVNVTPGTGTGGGSGTGGGTGMGGAGL